MPPTPILRETESSPGYRPIVLRFSAPSQPSACLSLIHLYPLTCPFLQENVSLIKEINELRKELKLTRSQVYDLEAALKLMKKMRLPEVPETGNVFSSFLYMGTHTPWSLESFFMPFT